MSIRLDRISEFSIFLTKIPIWCKSLDLYISHRVAERIMWHSHQSPVYLWMCSILLTSSPRPSLLTCWTVSTGEVTDSLCMSSTEELLMSCLLPLERTGVKRRFMRRRMWMLHHAMFVCCPGDITHLTLTGSCSDNYAPSRNRERERRVLSELKISILK